MNYKVIKATTPEHLELLVRECLTLGWMPVGGIATDPARALYYQALVIVGEVYIGDVDSDADTEDYI